MGNGGLILRGSVIAGVAGILLGMLVLLEIGRKFGTRDYREDPENAGKGLGPIVGALFGLMGLLLAFTFSGAGARFDARRHLIADEANDIGTAYRRIDLLPVDTQPRLRESFREYLDSRLDFYRNHVDDSAGQVEQERTVALQDDIWNQSLEAIQKMGSQPNAGAVTSLVIQSLNEMIDITTTRAVALQIHPPGLIYMMLAILVLVCSLLAGYESAVRKTRSWIHIVGFVVIMAASMVVILDYEYPRFGLIRVDSSDQVLVDLRNSMR